ncbi:CHAD domain-containing protein [Salibacterium salarium]|uniref:CHAD domain-containing protein n=1 Tax=Salibacterium salarium TaxID=284579 RepID=A0A428N6X3_9BACI|nr:CHAD domain-containing protein [Salibacterium salarium]RSL34062.1 CHAD domain-containing protein [Salibacterium salarium]
MVSKARLRQVDSMGRIVIPKDVRDQLQLNDHPLTLQHFMDRQAVVVTKATTKEPKEEHKLLDEQGRLLIPADIRHEYEWEKGEQIEVDVEEGSILLQGLLSKCAICESKYSLVKIKGMFLCDDCLAAGNQAIAARWQRVFDQLFKEYTDYCEKSVTFTDIEDVHQARVKGRRLQTLLVFLGVSQDHKLLEKLQDAHKRLGNVRERDVLVYAFEKRARKEENSDHANVYWKVRELVDEKRQKEQNKLENNLPKIINAKFVERWETFTARELQKRVLSLDVQERVTQYENHFAEKVEKYKVAVDEEGDSSKSALKALHDVRITSKELRYIYQYLGMIYGRNYADYAKQYKEYQRQFGDINDIRDWLSEIKNYRKKIDAPAEHVQAVRYKLTEDLQERAKKIDMEI